MSLKQASSSDLILSKAGQKSSPFGGVGKEFQENWRLYLMAMPAVLAILVFGYGPLFGLSIAFLDYSPARGITGSNFVGLKNFQDAFSNPFFWTAFQNSIIIQALKLAVGFPSAIILALLLNEMRLKWFKKTVQTATMLPYFLSWVIAGTMFRNLLGPSGVVNEVLVSGMETEAVSFLSDPNIFRWVIIFQDTWKYVGYFAVLYLAAMSAIDPALYEAAMVDGANRWQQIRFITLPGISRTMVTLLVLLTGYIFAGGFEQMWVMYNVSVYRTADILETFTARLGLQQARYSFATAVGLFQSVLSLTMVLLVNRISKWFNQEGLF
jgi:ABC-type polysaccharide transport system permease subunit